MQRSRAQAWPRPERPPFLGGAPGLPAPGPSLADLVAGTTNMQGEPQSLTAPGLEAGGLWGQRIWGLRPASPPAAARPRAWRFTRVCFLTWETGRAVCSAPCRVPGTGEARVKGSGSCLSVSLALAALASPGAGVPVTPTHGAGSSRSQQGGGGSRTNGHQGGGAGGPEGQVRVGEEDMRNRGGGRGRVGQADPGCGPLTGSGWAPGR